MHRTISETWISPNLAAEICGRYSAHQIRGMVDQIAREVDSTYSDLVSRRMVSERARYKVSLEFAQRLKRGEIWPNAEYNSLSYFATI